MAFDDWLSSNLWVMRCIWGGEGWLDAEVSDERDIPTGLGAGGGVVWADIQPTPIIPTTAATKIIFRVIVRVISTLFRRRNRVDCNRLFQSRHLRFTQRAKALEVFL